MREEREQKAKENAENIKKLINERRNSNFS
jgi:flagellar motor switch protein FliM